MLLHIPILIIDVLCPKQYCEIIHLVNTINLIEHREVYEQTHLILNLHLSVDEIQFNQIYTMLDQLEQSGLTFWTREGNHIYMEI